MRMTEKIFTHRRLERAHSAYFDACRGASALAVLFAHAVQLFRPAHATIISCFAGAAVMAFFVLSGFFIHKSLARVYQTRDWGSYVRGRCNRILPPFGACIALTLVLWLTAPILFESGTRAITAPSVRTEFSLEGLWETLAFLNPFVGTTLSANGPLWSLSYEVWYYALAALFALAVAGRRAGWVWLPLLIVLSTLQPWFAVYGGLWACGFLLSALHANGRYIELPRLPYWLVPAVLLAAVGLH
jgi:peptidoglycan/LPS O-acetylase OafA/YrhL